MDNDTFIYNFLYGSLKRTSYAGLRLSTDSNKTTLYSYYTAIAEYIKDIHGNNYLLISSDTLSPTTTRHLHILKNHLRNTFRYTDVLYMPQYYGKGSFSWHFKENLKRKKETLIWLKENNLYKKEKYRLQFIEFYRQLQELNMVEFMDKLWNITISDILNDIQAIATPIINKQMELLKKRIKTGRFGNYYSQELNKLQDLKFVA